MQRFKKAIWATKTRNYFWIKVIFGSKDRRRLKKKENIQNKKTNIIKKEKNTDGLKEKKIQQKEKEGRQTKRKKIQKNKEQTVESDQRGIIFASL